MSAKVLLLLTVRRRFQIRVLSCSSTNYLMTLISNALILTAPRTIVASKWPSQSTKRSSMEQVCSWIISLLTSTPPSHIQCMLMCNSIFLKVLPKRRRKMRQLRRHLLRYAIFPTVQWWCHRRTYPCQSTTSRHRWSCLRYTRIRLVGWS